MGIRVVCPNGHKLNVKSFLAGKRGVCPHCSAKFDIPANAEGGSGDEKMQSVGSVSAGNAGSSSSSAELRAGHSAKGNSTVRHIAAAGGIGVAPTAPSMPVATTAGDAKSASGAGQPMPTTVL